MNRPTNPVSNYKEINDAANALWELYDEAQNAGDTAQASAVAQKVFQLLEQLPENTVTLVRDRETGRLVHQ